VDPIGGDEESPVWCSRGYLKALVLSQLVRDLRESIVGFIEAANGPFTTALRTARAPAIGASREHPSLAMRARKPLPGCPTRVTGVPNKDLRKAAGRLPHQGPQTSRKRAPFDPVRPHLKHTGVPNKSYRGAQQGLPGSPTKSTGVSNKKYRGAQQVLPGRPTKTTGVPNKWHFLKLLQNEVFCVVFRGSFVFVYLVVLCC
jgi:hypothetical protein